MKRLLIKMAVAAMILALTILIAAPAAQARTFGWSSSSGTPAIVRIPADNNGHTRIISYWFTGDHANHNATVYMKYGLKTTLALTCVGTVMHVSAAASSAFWARVNLAAGDIIMIQNEDGSTVQHFTVASHNSSASTITLLTSTDATTGAIGNWMYKVTAQGTIPVGAASVNAQTDQGAIVGPKDSPLMIFLNGTSPSINVQWKIAP